MLNRYDLTTNLTTRLANETYKLHEPCTNSNYGDRTFNYYAPRLQKTANGNEKFIKYSPI